MSTTTVLLFPMDGDVYKVFWWCKTHDEVYFSEYVPYHFNEKKYGVTYIKPYNGPCNDKDGCTIIRLGPKRFSNEKLIFEYIDDPKEFGSEKCSKETLNSCQCINVNGEFTEPEINVKHSQ